MKSFFTALLALIGFACASQTFTINDFYYQPTETIIITYDGSTNYQDWFGIYPEGILPGDVASKGWKYVPNTGSGTLYLPIPDSLVNGDYELYYCSKNGYTVLAFTDFVLGDFGPQLPYNPVPADLKISVDIAADLTWNFGDTTETYDLYFGTDFPPTTLVVENEVADDIGAYSPTSLDSYTTYYWYVIAKNNDTLGTATSNIWSFTTKCGDSNVPIYEDFNSVATDEMPYCWSKLINTTNANAYVKTVTYGGIGSSNSVIFSNNTDIDFAGVLISPPIAGGIADKWVSFNAKRGTGSGPGQVVLGTMSDPSDFSTVSIFNIFEIGETYEENEISFSSYTGDDMYIVFMVFATDNYQITNIDNITIDYPPTCSKPKDLFVSEITTTTVALNWTESGSSTTWNIMYGTTGFDTTGVVGVSVTDNPFTLTELESGTDYDWYVQANCGTGDLSEWAGPFSFFTLCSAYDVPVVENFDAVTDPDLPACWSGIANSVTSNAKVSTSKIGDYSAPYCCRFYSGGDILATNILVSPQLNDVSSLWVEFMGMGKGDTIAIGIMSDPDDETTFFEYATFLVTSTYQEFSTTFEDYTGDGEYIAFKAKWVIANSNILFDDIVIDFIPTCDKPLDLYAENPAKNSISLGWSEDGGANTWDIEYGLAGFEPTSEPSLTVTENPYVLTELNPETEYEFYVRSVCNIDSISIWVGPMQFTTLCVEASIPYFEGFEDVIVPDPGACIEVENTNNDYYYWKSTVISAYEGTKSMYISFQFYEDKDDWFFSAPLDLLGGVEYTVSWRHTISSANLDEKLAVYWGDAPNSASMSIDEDTIFYDDYLYGLNWNWDSAGGTFTPEVNGIYYIGWHSFSEKDKSNLYIDNIYVDVYVDENILQVLVSSDITEVCENAEVQLFAEGSYGTGVYTYSWTSDPAGFTSDNQNPTDAPSVTTKYYCEISDGNTTHTDSVVINVLPISDVTLDTFDEVCIDADAFEITGGLPTGGIFSGFGIMEGLFYPSIAGTGTHTITYTYTEGNGCESIVEAGLTVNALPDVSLTLFDTVCVETSDTVLTGGLPADGVYSGNFVNNGVFHPAEAGTGTHYITYTYKDDNGCENSVETGLYVKDCYVGIDDMRSDLSIHVFPNPNKGLFTLIVNSETTQRVGIRIVNNKGDKVYEQQNVALEGDYSTEVNLSEYAGGMYFVEIITKESTVVEKIIVE